MSTSTLRLNIVGAFGEPERDSVITHLRLGQFILLQITKTLRSTQNVTPTTDQHRHFAITYVETKRPNYANLDIILPSDTPPSSPYSRFAGAPTTRSCACWASTATSCRSSTSPAPPGSPTRASSASLGSTLLGIQYTFWI